MWRYAAWEERVWMCCVTRYSNRWCGVTHTIWGLYVYVRVVVLKDHSEGLKVWPSACVSKGGYVSEMTLKNCVDISSGTAVASLSSPTHVQWGVKVCGRESGTKQGGKSSGPITSALWHYNNGKEGAGDRAKGWGHLTNAYWLEKNLDLFIQKDDVIGQSILRFDELSDVYYIFTRENRIHRIRVFVHEREERVSIQICQRLHYLCFSLNYTSHFIHLLNSSPSSPLFSLHASVTPHRAPFLLFIILFFLPEDFQFQAPPFFFYLHSQYISFSIKVRKGALQTQIKAVNLIGIKPWINVSGVFSITIFSSSCGIQLMEKHFRCLWFTSGVMKAASKNVEIRFVKNRSR